jgi:hypothetical protein
MIQQQVTFYTATEEPNTQLQMQYLKELIRHMARKIVIRRMLFKRDVIDVCIRFK